MFMHAVNDGAESSISTIHRRIIKPYMNAKNKKILEEINEASNMTDTMCEKG